jgi:hypothetical protein
LGEIILTPEFDKFLTAGKNMKTMKLIYPLAFALAITLASTGCRSHKPVGITPIPGENSGIVGGGDSNGTMSGRTIASGNRSWHTNRRRADGRA